MVSWCFVKKQARVFWAYGVDNFYMGDNVVKVHTVGNGRSDTEADVAEPRVMSSVDSGSVSTRAWID
ncbi:Cysteine-rich receptor-like protein kinase [Corchorus olitorius]|uniref:Cysteine-rich receptor-like protein kinase n=1 Tax=Corchorus olitorius TaxID=93759 RepID=A0A1R3KX27_9ROSI|nr:Cysteine-rich receptor-like protein kinase [Corchorus olitorius]